VSEPYQAPSGEAWQSDRLSALAPPHRPEPLTRYLVLFALTLVTTTLSGAIYYFGYASEIGRVELAFSWSELLPNGLWYSVPVLLILGAHEFGHYFACRYYRVNASLPYFLPFWLPVALPLPGTFGAVIRIRQPIATKRQFFDIGIAGPIAGFVVLVPILVFAMSASTVVVLPDDHQGFNFGEPLLFQFVAWLWFGEIAANSSVNLHPAGWAAWFGMLATALNLAPVGQLDGGHVSYAVFGRRSTAITIACTILLVALLFVSTAYLLWTTIVVGMVLAMGPRHPRTLDEDEPLDRTRLSLAAFAVVMFILCFTPVPIELVGFPD
jgi:membrane-associated protease RseP (regulator of RpoE activity)